MIRLAVASAVLMSAAAAFAEPPGMTPPAGARPATPPVPPRSVPAYAPVYAPPSAAAAPPMSLAPPGMMPMSMFVDRPLVERATGGSYRAQTLLVDAASVAVIFAAANANNGGLAVAGVTGWALGAPLVHTAHHHGGRAAASLLLRVGLPILGGVIGNKLAQPSAGSCYDGYDDCGDADAQVAATAFGVLIGAATASVIDTAYLARGDDAPAIAPRLAGSTTGFGISF